MHPRRIVLGAIKSALTAATSPPLAFFEGDVTAHDAPCWQADASVERRGEGSTREAYERHLEFSVAAIGTTPEQRDDMSEQLEAVLFGAGVLGSFELEWDTVDLSVPKDGAGERIYPATYRCVAQMFTSR